ncbi:hypothetical protein Tco_1329766 [Tanacetum coccineum]
MSTKDSITTQTCKLSQGEFNDFLALYAIPSEYHVILPKSNQTVFDDPPGHVGLYTHSFSLENLRLPLTEFFYEVREYFKMPPKELSEPKWQLRHKGYHRLMESPKALGGVIKVSRVVHAKTSTSKDDAPFLSISDDDEGLSDCFELKDANAY